MKKSTLTLVTMIALISSLLANPNTSINRCRIELMDKDTYTSIVTRNEEDLLSGIWTSSTMIGSEETQTLLFDKSGSMMVLSSTFDKGITVYQKSWRVMDYDGKAFLVISETNKSKEELYQLTQTCEGIELMNVANGKQFRYNYSSIGQKTDRNQLSKELVGTWSSSNYPFEIAQNVNQCGSFIPVQGAYFSIELNKDGSYTKTFGSDLQKYTQSGKWEISKDGKFVIFKTNNINGKKLKNTQLEAMEIERYNGNKLHAKGAIATKDNTTLFCTNTKTFSFTR
jgi:hypothetical protein